MIVTFLLRCRCVYAAMSTQVKLTLCRQPAIRSPKELSDFILGNRIRVSEDSVGVISLDDKRREIALDVVIHSNSTQKGMKRVMEVGKLRDARFLVCFVSDGRLFNYETIPDLKASDFSDWHETETMYSPSLALAALYSNALDRRLRAQSKQLLGTVACAESDGEVFAVWP